MNTIERIRKLKALWLKQQRKEAGLTQVELAKLTTMCQETISRIESGNYQWNCDSEFLYLEAIRIHKERLLFSA